MRRLSLAMALGVSACLDPPPYVLSEDDVRIYAEHRCRASAECCDADVVVEECATALTREILGYEDLTDATLTYSESCMSALVAWSPAIDCGTAVEIEGPGCALALGDRALGEPCTVQGDFVLHVTDCRAGLQCMAGRCVDDPFFVTQRAREGERCDPFTWCETGLFCNGDGTCQLFAEPGSPCTQHNACGPLAEYYCHGFMEEAGECVRKAQAGEPCDPREPAACVLPCDDDGCHPLTCTEGLCSPLGPAVCE